MHWALVCGHGAECVCCTHLLCRQCDAARDEAAEPIGTLFKHLATQVVGVVAAGTRAWSCVNPAGGQGGDLPALQLLKQELSQTQALSALHVAPIEPQLFELQAFRQARSVALHLVV